MVANRIHKYCPILFLWYKNYTGCFPLTCLELFPIWECLGIANVYSYSFMMVLYNAIISVTVFHVCKTG